MYEAIAPDASADIVGISYEFEGSGSVDFVRFRRLDGTTAYADEFDSMTTHTASVKDGHLAKGN